MENKPDTNDKYFLIHLYAIVERGKLTRSEITLVVISV